MRNKGLIFFSILLFLGVVGFGFWLIKSKLDVAGPALKPGQEILPASDSGSTAATNIDKGSKNIEKQKLLVTYNYTAKELGSIFNVAKNNGFFDRHNLDIELLAYASNTDKFLASGEADVEVNGLSDALALYLDNVDVRWLASIFEPASYGVSRYPKDQSSQIKKVAIDQLWSMAKPMTVIALKQLGVNPGQVEFIIVKDEETKVDLLAKGQVDFALISSEKVITQKKMRENYTVYEPSEILYDPTIELGIFTTKKALDSNSQAIKDFVAAMAESRTFFLSNHDKIVNGFVINNNLSPAMAEKIYSNAYKGYTYINFVPEISRAEAALENVKIIYPLASYSRDLKDFVYPDFAKTMVRQ